jgi:ligand-binding SRPBCC domain-containing protein
MAIYQFRATQNLPITLQEAWDFIFSPYNLLLITPPGMSLEMISGATPGEPMYKGQLITYRVKPILGIAFKWVTEITYIEHLNHFIDEQRNGPYNLWHHEHFLKEIEGGVQMDDIITYKLPLGFLGNTAHSLFVKNKLVGLFDFRFKKLEEMFGKF